jgi:hypothetical protein
MSSSRLSARVGKIIFGCIFKTSLPHLNVWGVDYAQNITTWPSQIFRPSHGPDVEDKIEFVSSAQQPTQ